MAEEPIEITVEKLQAKFEMYDNLRKALEEKISAMSEQIGELRSTMIEREKFYKDIELSARKMEAIIEMIKKEELLKIIKKREKDVEENKARIERVEKLIEKFRDEMSELRELIAKIKPIDEILELSRETEKNLRYVEEKKNYFDSMVNKVEKLYVDVRKFMADFQTVKSDSVAMKEEIKDILKIVDSLKLEIEKEKEYEPLESKPIKPPQTTNIWENLYAKWQKKQA